MNDLYLIEKELECKINKLCKLIQYNIDFKHSIKDFKNLTAELFIAEMKLEEIQKQINNIGE